jgi:hypothetical protein
VFMKTARVATNSRTNTAIFYFMITFCHFQWAFLCSKDTIQTLTIYLQYSLGCRLIRGKQGIFRIFARGIRVITSLILRTGFLFRREAVEITWLLTECNGSVQSSCVCIVSEQFFLFSAFVLIICVRDAFYFVDFRREKVIILDRIVTEQRI